MKSLDLTTRPLWFNSLDGTCYSGTTHEDVVNVDFEVCRKRLTDAELAAEVHSQREAWAAALYDDVYARYIEESKSATSSKQRFRIAERAKVLHRFATLPHYDEGES